MCRHGSLGSFGTVGVGEQVPLGSLGDFSCHRGARCGEHEPRKIADLRNFFQVAPGPTVTAC